MQSTNFMLKNAYTYQYKAEKYPAYVSEIHNSKIWDREKKTNQRIYLLKWNWKCPQADLFSKGADVVIQF